MEEKNKDGNNDLDIKDMNKVYKIHYKLDIDDITSNKENRQYAELRYPKNILLMPKPRFQFKKSLRI